MCMLLFLGYCNDTLYIHSSQLNLVKSLFMLHIMAQSCVLVTRSQIKTAPLLVMLVLHSLVPNCENVSQTTAGLESM